MTSADVLEVLTPTWRVKAQTARNVRQRISAMMEWAIAMNLRGQPCASVLPVLGKQNEVVLHMRAPPHPAVPAAIATVRASNAAEFSYTTYRLSGAAEPPGRASGRDDHSGGRPSRVSTILFGVETTMARYSGRFPTLATG